MNTGHDLHVLSAMIPFIAFRDDNEKTPIKFTYTAMHGVGYPFTDKSVQQFGFPPVIPVKEQVFIIDTHIQIKLGTHVPRNNTHFFT